MYRSTDISGLARNRPMPNPGYIRPFLLTSFDIIPTECGDARFHIM